MVKLRNLESEVKIMKLGADFFKIVQLIEFIIRVLKEWSKENNEDSPKGSV